MEKVDVSLPPQNQNSPVIWVIGGPGSGKGTLCSILSRNHNFFHISAGELLRNEVKSGSTLGTKIENTMKNGGIVEMEITLHLIEKAMAENIYHNGYLIDGFPREVEQGIQFEKQIRSADCLLYLKTSEETLKKRLRNRSKTSNRVDDNEESIHKRLQIYNKLKEKILKVYQKKIREISAEPPIDEVYQAAVSVLSDFISTDEEQDSDN